MIVHKSKQINEVSELKVDIWKQNHDDKNESFDQEYNLTDKIKVNILVVFYPAMVAIYKI